MSTQGQLTIALAIATPGTGWGGMEKHSADLVVALAAEGHEVHVLAHAAYQDRFADPVRFHPLPFQLGRRNLWLRHCLRRTLRSIRPDILHAQGNKAASLISAGAHHARATVGTLHGTKSSHKAFDKLDGVIGVSREITGSINHPCVRLVYNGVTVPDNQSNPVSRIPIPTERPLFVAAGRLEPVKQFDRLIRAWDKANPGGILVILGNGTQRAPLEQLVQKLNASDTIKLPGYEPNIPGWLSAATACIISSEREGFSYICAEALTAFCPVLSTPVGIAKEFLPKSSIAQSDSIDDLAALIRAGVNGIDSLAAAQANSFHQARTQFSLETMVANTEAFYRDLLASVPARH
ncbi:MAG: glycosyltransferase [Marinobacter sp.]